MQSDAKPKLLTVLDIVAVVMLLVATAMVFFYAPMEAVMGQVQKVFYFHVASAWVGMLGFLVAAVAGVAYLRTGRPQVGYRRSGSAVEIGMVFCPDHHHHRLDLGAPDLEHLVDLGPAPDHRHHHGADLRRLPDAAPGHRRPRPAGALWGGVCHHRLHQRPADLLLHPHVPHHPPGGDRQQPARGDGGFDMTPKMLQTFLFSLFTFSVIFADLLWHRIRLGRLADRVEQMKLKTAE